MLYKKVFFDNFKLLLPFLKLIADSDYRFDIILRQLFSQIFIILLKRMETILRRVKKGEQKEEKGLVIHGDSYQAFYDGKPLELTLSEFLLLQVLEKDPNRAFTREQLILQIFNEDYVGNDRIIDAHVKNLRKKLPKNYIKTVIGIGYQFKEGE